MDNHPSDNVTLIVINLLIIIVIILVIFIILDILLIWIYDISNMDAEYKYTKTPVRNYIKAFAFFISLIIGIFIWATYVTVEIK